MLAQPWRAGTCDGSLRRRQQAAATTRHASPLDSLSLTLRTRLSVLTHARDILNNSGSFTFRRRRQKLTDGRQRRASKVFRIPAARCCPRRPRTTAPSRGRGEFLVAHPSLPLVLGRTSFPLSISSEHRAASGAADARRRGRRRRPAAAEPPPRFLQGGFPPARTAGEQCARDLPVSTAPRLARGPPCVHLGRASSALVPSRSSNTFASPRAT
jgi:hypothetical protein